MDTIRPTRYPDLGYMEHGGIWRIVTTEDGAAVGPQYATKAELLADLDRYAAEYLGKPDPRDARIRELEGALRSITSEAEGASNFLRNEFAGFVSIDTAQRLESCSRITRRVLGGAS